MKNQKITAVFIVLFFLWLPSTQAAHLPAAGIATAHPLATEAGFDILKAGGNAFDAAVAVTAALAVVEPMSSGLGGGGFWLLHRDADGFETMVDGREKAPIAAHRDMYLDHDGNVVPELSLNGPLAAGIPGVPAAMVYLSSKYGRLSLQQTLAPAIHYAREGFAIDEHYRQLIKFRLDAIKKSAEAAHVFLKDGNVPTLGYIVKQPDLAVTLETIAKTGNKGFYAGEVAHKLVDGVRAKGGVWSLQDLTDYRVVERKPIYTNYKDLRIVSAAPPSSGGIAIATMLNILSGYELNQLNSVTRKHLIIEAMRRAYRDRAEYLGDPDFVNVPIEQLISPFYGAGLRASIRLDRATPSNSLPGSVDELEGTNTTHFSIIDKKGNRVAATLSINYPFGSGFVAPGTGVLLNDEMDDFSAKPGAPNAYGLVGGEANAIAPGKRPLSSMSPTFVENDRGVAIIGTPGGSRIITMVLLAILDYDSGGGPESMVSLKRYHHQFLPDVVQYEQGAFSDEEIEDLTNLGHTLKQINRAYGDMQVVVWDKHKGIVEAGSDPRRNGKALVQ